MEENKILEQELDEKELEEVSGGRGCSYVHHGDPIDLCTAALKRTRSKDGCSATVEDGSLCVTDDACHSNAIVYQDRGSDCYRTDFYVAVK